MLNRVNIFMIKSRLRSFTLEIERKDIKLLKLLFYSFSREDFKKERSIYFQNQASYTTMCYKIYMFLKCNDQLKKK